MGDINGVFSSLCSDFHIFPYKFHFIFLKYISQKLKHPHTHTHIHTYSYKDFIIRSAAISPMMTKIYSFRQRVIKIQRVFRSWFRVLESRIELLSLALERSEVLREYVLRQEHLRNERSALASLTKTEIFGNTL